MAVLVLLVLVVLLGAGFFLPTILAFRREHPNRWLIFVLNVAFGATFVGWVIALIWALNAAHKPRVGSSGGESGLNLFVNDPKSVRFLPSQGSGTALTAKPTAGEVVLQIERLKDLLESGAITHTEFARLKDGVLREV